MKTRDKTYKDYGFADGEAKRLKEYCRSDEFTEEDKLILWNASEIANPTISKLLFNSIRNRMSYYKLCDEDYVPLPPHDFYGYQRLCLYHMRRMLKDRDRW